MKDFLNEDFLLPDESSRTLFHDYAEGMPILDYHCHLPPADIAGDARFPDIAQAWLGGDHYKWRAMRANGLSEAEVTGRRPDKRSFAAWARTLSALVGNPLFHWSHLELRRYFGIEAILDERSADAVWEACNERLAGPDFGARALLRRMRVRAVCTTDDPADSLEHHASYAAYRGSPASLPDEPLMVPTFRPDRALAVESIPAWRAYLLKLGAAAGLEVVSYRSLVEALESRHAFFHSLGCRLSDHALVQVPGRPVGEARAAALFDKAFSAPASAGVALSPEEAEELKTALLLEVGRMDARRAWTMQLHLAAMRNLNSRMFAALGPDTGFDSANDPVRAAPLAAFLDALDGEGLLPKTILYSLNPNDYDLMASVMGCFQDGSIPGKMQLGSSWWFNDHIDGMEMQLKAIANLGLLPRFVGMLTDSRSFLSYPRHEYFRRILCRLLGGWMERGEAPSDLGAMGDIVRDICWRNARGYFGLPGIRDRGAESMDD
jgi:glucuronate isomerase